MPRPGQKILVTFYQNQPQIARLLALTRYVGSILQTYVYISIYTHTCAVNCHWKVSPCFHRQKILTFTAITTNVSKSTYHWVFFSTKMARYSPSVTFWNYEVLRRLCNAIHSFFKELFTRIKQETSLAFGSSPPSDLLHFSCWEI